MRSYSLCNYLLLGGSAKNSVFGQKSQKGQRFQLPQLDLSCLVFQCELQLSEGAGVLEIFSDLIFYPKLFLVLPKVLPKRPLKTCSWNEITL